MAVERQLPFFIKARSPQGLRRLMIQTNTKQGYTFHYFDIQHVNGNWYAWYYKDLKSTNSEDIEELNNDKT